jgi:heat shock protein HslJ
MLDQKGNAITGDLARNYILTKGNYSILNKKWRLTELMGKKITSNETMGKEAFLMLDDKENRYSASVGCNTILNWVPSIVCN